MQLSATCADKTLQYQNHYNLFHSNLVLTWVFGREEFVYFAEICFRELGDKVKFWATFNEPNVVAKFGYMEGTYPPGRCSAPYGNCSDGNSDFEPFVAAHNIILSHAKAVHVYRNQYQVIPQGRTQKIFHGRGDIKNIYEVV